MILLPPPGCRKTRLADRVESFGTTDGSVRTPCFLPSHAAARKDDGRRSGVGLPWFRSDKPAGRVLLRSVLTALLIVLSAMAPGSGAATRAAEGEATRALEGLQRWLDGTSTLSGRFEQTLVTEALGGEIRESGRVYLRRPGYMRWDYEDPENKTALVLNDETLLYLEDEGQLVRGRIDIEAGMLPELLAGDGRLSELFEAEVEDGGVAGTRLRLVPRTEAEVVESVTLTLRSRDHAIESAEVIDPAGNRMDYRFRDLRRNRPLPAGIFDLQVPPGTEIVETP